MKHAQRAQWIFVLTLIVSFCIVAALSDYVLVPSEKINSDIVLMLTPVGIVQNLVLAENPPLHRFYFAPTVRTGIFDRPFLLVMIVAVIVQAAGLLFLFRKKRVG